MFKFRFAYKIHLLEECRNFCLLHFKKLDWFNKLSQEDKSHKAMIAKNKYKRYTKYTSGHMRDQLIKVHEAYQSLRLELSYLLYEIQNCCCRKKYEGKFDSNPPRAMFKGSYGSYREEGSALDQRYALVDTGLKEDPWEKFCLE